MFSYSYFFLKEHLYVRLILSLVSIYSQDQFDG